MLELTHEQHIMSNTWARGSDWWPIRKVRAGKWLIDTSGIFAPLGQIPIVFKTKRAAQDFFNNLCLIRFREWRGVA